MKKTQFNSYRQGSHHGYGQNVQVRFFGVPLPTGLVVGAARGGLGDAGVHEVVGKPAVVVRRLDDHGDSPGDHAYQR